MQSYLGQSLKLQRPRLLPPLRRPRGSCCNLIACPGAAQPAPAGPRPRLLWARSPSCHPDTCPCAKRGTKVTFGTVVLVYSRVSSNAQGLGRASQSQLLQMSRPGHERGDAVCSPVGLPSIAPPLRSGRRPVIRRWPTSPQTTPIHTAQAAELPALPQQSEMPVVVSLTPRAGRRHPFRWPSSPCLLHCGTPEGQEF